MVFKPKTIKQKYRAVFHILLSELKEEKGENHIKKTVQFCFLQIRFFILFFGFSFWTK